MFSEIRTQSGLRELKWSKSSENLIKVFKTDWIEIPAEQTKCIVNQCHMSRLIQNQQNGPSKTQISLSIRPVSSDSSLSAWRKLGPLATHRAHSEDSDQTGRMPRLIWVFAGRTAILLVCPEMAQICLLPDFQNQFAQIKINSNEKKFIKCPGSATIRSRRQPETPREREKGQKLARRK